MPVSADIVILHTNDMHGRMTPAAGARLRELRARYPGCLLLDAGDAISAGNLGFRVGGEPMLREMSDIGYDAMTVGNRESHPRREVFPRKLAGAAFPVLCANVTVREGAELPVRPYVELEAGSVKIAVFGVTVPMFTRKQWSAALCDYFFDPPIPAAQRLADELRPQFDVVIALTHIGFKEDLKLAQTGPSVDLIIGGHSHTDLDEPRMENGIPIVQARSHAFFAGVARLSVGDAGARLVEWRKVALRDDAPRAAKG